MSQHIVTGLDIGTERVRAAVMAQEGEVSHVIGVGNVPMAEGAMRRGVVVNIDDAARSVIRALEMAERSSGIRIDSAYIGIGGDHVVTQSSTGTVAISRANGEVSDDDVTRVVDEAAAVSLESNREIIHVIPREFQVDGQGGIQNPTGMFGARLEVKTALISVSTPFLRNMLKVVERAELEVNEVVASALAAAESTLTKRQRELGAVVVDIGGGTTSIAVVEEGIVLSVAVLPLGATIITKDLAVVLRIAPEIADAIKLEYGSALPLEVNHREMVQLAAFNEREEGEVSRRQVAEIIEARVQEILEMVNGHLHGIERNELLPAGAVIVGGGAKIPGIVDIAKDELRLPADIGFPTVGVEGMVDQIDDPCFATAAGLARWGLRNGEGHRSLFPGSGSLHDTMRSLRRWFGEFLP